MPSKYYNTISKINTDENFKNDLVKKLKSEEAKIKEKQTKTTKIDLLKIKIKNFLITVGAIIGILLGSGVAYAKINNIPFLEIFGFTFSDEYTEYVEPVVNQVVEDDNIKITLESTVCDDGFTVLQFRINVKSDEYIERYSSTEDNILCATYLSFNDPIIDENGDKYLNLAVANYNAIINGEKTWMRGASAQGFDYISDREAIFYQAWFFDEDNFENQTEFTLTLEDIAVGLGEDVIPLEGKFEVTVSKERAKQNTKMFDSENESFAYKKSINKIEKVLMTPMQNIVKISKTQKDVGLNDLTYVLDEDYIGYFSYVVYDQDNNLLVSSSITSEEQITYEDGEINSVPPGECEFRESFSNAEFLSHEYLIVEKNENIKKLRIEVNERNDYYEITKKVAEFNIDLEKETIKAEEFDEIIEVNNEIKYLDYLQSQIDYINDDKVDEISKGNTDFIFLYNGFEIEKNVGVQYPDYMEINNENIEKYNINYYNYRNNEYAGKSKGIFGKDIAYENTSWVNNVTTIATSKKYDLIPRKITNIYDIPESLKNEKYSETMLVKVDLDGDNKFEYIGINIERPYVDFSEEIVQPGVLECSTTISLYDNNFEIINTLITINDDYADTYEHVVYADDIQFVDIDNDGIIEILIEFPVWDSSGISIYKYNNGTIS